MHPFVISRIFDAPREDLWEAWSEPDHLLKWFSPRGCAVIGTTMDFRVGGCLHNGVSTPDGREMWGKFTYREITAPKRLVYVTAFSDRDGGLTRHPFSATWPLEMLTTVTFAAHGERTQITIEWLPLGGTEIELQTFDGARESMKHGWSGSLDQLARHLQPCAAATAA